jgi:SAM-dependent methyltransferase
VLEEPYRYPFADGEFDVIVSTSCLEHDPAFWLSFAEMARVLRPGGFLYVSAPVNGPYHGHPGDCWRFYPDAAKALAKWTKHCGHELTLLEAFLIAPIADVWVDNVSIYGKPPVPLRSRATNRLVERGYRLQVIA